MTELGFSSTSFDFLKALEANNNKVWMEANRSSVKEHLQDPFAFMLECASRELSDAELPLSGGKKTMFRLHRDIRFSKDKRPYNLHISGLLTPSGVKNENDGLAYARLDLDGGFLAAGFYALNAKQLGPFRDNMIEEPNQFETLIGTLNENGLALETESSLSSMPRGYSEHKNHDFVTYLKLKRFIVRQDLKQEDWYKQDMVKKLSDFSKRAAPLLQFGRKLLV
jgi:uncharacterized protein (TIGR02453 family)